MGPNHEKNGGRKSRDTLPLTNPLGFLIGMLKYFRIWIQFRGDIRIGIKNFASAVSVTKKIEKFYGLGV